MPSGLASFSFGQKLYKRAKGPGKLAFKTKDYNDRFKIPTRAIDNHIF